jgi:Suppressor of fused protein (SUFU)
VIYPRLFGSESEGIFTIPWKRLEAGQLSDPRWATCGVFRFAPTVQRQSWLYVSSGLSNAWFDDKPDATRVSGFGCEFILEAVDCVDWPIQRIHQLMVYQIGLCVGRYPDHDAISAGNRIPFGSPIDFGTSRLAYGLLINPPLFPTQFKQESGVAEFLQLVGISESERDFAKLNGNASLEDWLRTNTCYPTTDPARQEMPGGGDR